MEGRAEHCLWWFMCERTKTATACQALGVTPADVLYRHEQISVSLDPLRMATEKELQDEGWRVLPPVQHRM